MIVTRFFVRSFESSDEYGYQTDLHVLDHGRDEGGYATRYVMHRYRSVLYA